MKFELTVKEKVFKTDDGEEINYFDCVAVIGGTEVRFVPKPEDKSLFKYLVSSIKKANGGVK